MEDVIYLLSEKEYWKYKKNITNINWFWWLSSKVVEENNALVVCSNGSTTYSFVDDKTVGIRPVLNLNEAEIEVSGDLFVYCGVTWMKIAEELAISELPIGFQMFDLESNNYETSEVRKWLLKWYEERKNF